MTDAQIGGAEVAAAWVASITAVIVLCATIAWLKHRREHAREYRYVGQRTRR